MHEALLSTADSRSSECNPLAFSHVELNLLWISQIIIDHCSNVECVQYNRGISETIRITVILLLRIVLYIPAHPSIYIRSHFRRENVHVYVVGQPSFLMQLVWHFVGGCLMH